MTKREMLNILIRMKDARLNTVKRELLLIFTHQIVPFLHIEQHALEAEIEVLEKMLSETD